MKRNIAIALFALSTLGTAASVLAQTPAVEANVPFQFTVGGKQLPAGAYTITSTSAGVVQIQSADKRFSAEAVAYTGNQQSTDGSKLDFETHGDQYFLHDVLCPGPSGGRCSFAAHAASPSPPASRHTPCANGSTFAPRSPLLCTSELSFSHFSQQLRSVAVGSRPALADTSCLVPCQAPLMPISNVFHWHKIFRALYHL